MEAGLSMAESIDWVGVEATKMVWSSAQFGNVLRCKGFAFFGNLCK
jgi:hypothetical protein